MATILPKKRRYRSDQKKPGNAASYVVGAFGIISILYLVFLIRYAIISEGNSNRFLTAIGVIMMLVALTALVKGIKEAADDTASFESRAFGVIVPLLAFGAWMVIYVIGIMGIQL